ncbi:Cell wall protein RBR3 [Candida viswanathii]|uniref:Cell wall protein RBR3 n=1 Tax=Candida viswanathii TaxID=5486 RepID=A0A367YKV7_9ASCO|nr:Cell wall protein RBR3 [Candida viswanathii]
MVIDTLVPLWLLVNYVFTLEIATNRVDRGNTSLSVGDITIKSGLSWSVIDNAVSTLTGDLNVEPNAGFYITLGSSLFGLDITTAPPLSTITNNGVIVFSSSLATSEQSSYNLDGYSFTNNGGMYFGAASGTMAITATSWSNTGTMLFHHDTNASATVLLGAPQGSITNNGNICLFNLVFKQTTAVAGTGCIVAKKNAAIYVANSRLAVATTQSFFLADSKSSLIVEAASTPQTFTVYGFGNGNTIGLDAPLKGVFLLRHLAFRYNAESGVLTLRAGSRALVNVHIGKGYDAKLFSIVSSNNNNNNNNNNDSAGLPTALLNSVQYNGPVPEQTVPTSCRIDCAKLPSIPGTLPASHANVAADQTVLINKDVLPVSSKKVSFTGEKFGVAHRKGISLMGKRSDNPSLLSCYIGGEEVAVVDYETGVCDFTIPDHLETFFYFVSLENYNVQYYYASFDGQRYKTDVATAGRVISIPAKLLNTAALELVQVHLQKVPTAGTQNSSTAATEEFVKRDDLDDFLSSLGDDEGTPIDVTVSASPATETEYDNSTLSETSSWEEASSEPVDVSSVPAELTPLTESSSTPETVEPEITETPVTESSESSSIVPSQSETTSVVTEPTTPPETESPLLSDDQGTPISVTISAAPASEGSTDNSTVAESPTLEESSSAPIEESQTSTESSEPEFFSEFPTESSEVEFSSEFPTESSELDYSSAAPESSEIEFSSEFPTESSSESEFSSVAPESTESEFPTESSELEFSSELPTESSEAEYSSEIPSESSEPEFSSFASESSQVEYSSEFPTESSEVEYPSESPTESSGIEFSSIAPESSELEYSSTAPESSESQYSEWPIESSEPEYSTEVSAESSEIEYSSELPTESSEPEFPTESEYSSELPTESGEVEFSSAAPESSEAEHSSEFPTESSEVDYSSELPTESSETEFSSEIPIESSEAEYSSEFPTESSEPEYSSEIPTESSEPEYSSELPTESSEVIYSSEFPTESSEVVLSESESSSETAAESEYSSGIPTESSEPEYSSEFPIESSEAEYSSEFPTESSEIEYSSEFPTEPSESEYSSEYATESSEAEYSSEPPAESTEEEFSSVSATESAESEYSLFESTIESSYCDGESCSTEPTLSSTVSSSIEVSSSLESSSSSESPLMVNCYMNGEIVSVVDYENGVCQFTIPSDYETFFNFVSSSNYNVQYYYAQVNGIKYTTDIQRAGRVISVPARELLYQGIVLYQVHLQKSPSRRLLKRDEANEYGNANQFVAAIADTEGTPLDVTISNGIVTAGASTGTGTFVCEEVVATETDSSLTDGCALSSASETGFVTATHVDSPGEAAATLSEWREGPAISESWSNNSHAVGGKGPAVVSAASVPIVGVVTTVLTTEYITTCSNGDVSTTSGVVIVGTDSTGGVHTITSGLGGTSVVEKTITSTVTECLLGACLESTTTLTTTVPWTTLDTAAVAASESASGTSGHNAKANTVEGVVADNSAAPSGQQESSQTAAIVLPIDNGAVKSSTGVSVVCGLLLSGVVAFV